MQQGSGGKPEARAFATFGRVRSRSNFYEPAKMGSTKWANRSITVSPLNIEHERANSIMHMAFGKSQMYEVSYENGLSFSTKVETYVEPG